MGANAYVAFGNGLGGRLLFSPNTCDFNHNGCVGNGSVSNKKIMNSEQILNAIRSLASSQGFYGRLYERLTDGSDEAKIFLTRMEMQNFADVVSMVIWLES